MVETAQRKRAKPAYREGLGIVNPYGQFWGTELFSSEEQAKAHFFRFWKGCSSPPSWDDYRVAPARLRIQESYAAALTQGEKP